MIWTQTHSQCGKRDVMVKTIHAHCDALWLYRKGWMLNGGKIFLYTFRRTMCTNKYTERTHTNKRTKGDIEWKSQHKVCSWQEEKGPNISTNIPAKKSGWKRDPNWASKLAHEWTERTVGKRAFSYSLCTFNLGKCSLTVSSLWSTCDYLHRWKRENNTHRNTKGTKSIPTDLSRFRECKVWTRLCFRTSTSKSFSICFLFVFGCSFWSWQQK